MASEIKTLVKKEFNYQIPIAEVEKAGISSTGSQIENELEPLAKEFKSYREKNKLWKTLKEEINEDEIESVKIIDGIASEPKNFYGKQIQTMQTVVNTRINFIDLIQLENWSVQALLDSNVNYSNRFKLAKIGEFLKIGRAHV